MLRHRIGALIVGLIHHADPCTSSRPALIRPEQVTRRQAQRVPRLGLILRISLGVPLLGRTVILRSSGLLCIRVLVIFILLLLYSYLPFILNRCFGADNRF